MPYDMRVITCKDFLRADANGDFDLQATRRFMSDAVWASFHAGVQRVLLDVRDATTEMTLAQVMNACSALNDMTPIGEQYRLAILNQPKDDFDRAAYAADVAQAEGRNIRAFRSFEEAFDWLRG